jgi:hypothetical protein
MRDIIWTIIVVWLIFRIVSVFRSAGKRTQQHGHSGSTSNADFNAAKPQKDLQSAVRKSMNQEGEYVEFEEVK